MNNSVLTVAEVSKLLHRDPQTIRFLIDNGLVAWGLSFRRPGSKRKCYLIYRDKFVRETGIEITGSEVFECRETIPSEIAVEFYNCFSFKIACLETTAQKNDVLSQMQEAFQEVVRSQPSVRDELSEVYQSLKVRCEEVV